METKATSSETLEERNSVFLCSLSENCTSDVYGGHCEISHVDLSRKLGHISLDESVVFDGVTGNNQINKGSLGSESAVCGDSIAGNQINNDVLVSEGELKCSGRVEENVEKSDDYVLLPQKPCSPSKIEISGNGINLSVDDFGPLDGIPNQESSFQENRTIYLGVENASAKKEGEDVAVEQELTFDVGDLVWVKTRNLLWWPGIISDPIESNHAAKSEKRGSFFVKLFGNIYSVWCNSLDLKPFMEHFEQMSVQNKSRNFSGSVERALCEFGQRVKTKMTCLCFSKDGQKLEKSRSNREENSLSQFDPATFSARIRNLACSVNAPGTVELTVMKIRLSSFYCSVGHCQLPLHLLRSGSDTAQNVTSEIVDEGLNNNASRSFRNSRKGNARDGDVTVGQRRKRNIHSDDNNVATSGKGSESRERKKSKYLSYPYIDVKNVVSTAGPKTEDIKKLSSPSKKTNDLGSCSGTKSRKKGSKKSQKVHLVISKEDDIDACSTELLNELCSTARDCFYLGGSKYSDSLKRFYGSFRMYAFLNADISKDEVEMKTDNSEGKGKVVKKRAKKKEKSISKDLAPNSAEANEVQMKTDNAEAKESVVKKRAKKKEKSISTGLVQTEGDELQMKTDNLEAKESAVKKKAKKKKEKPISKVLESTKDSSNVDRNICMISFQQTSNTPLPDIDSISILPDLNRIQTAPLVENIPVGEASTDQAKSLPDQKIEGLAPPNTTVTLEKIPQSNECSTNGLSSFASQPLQMEILPSVDKPERKKRKRKEKVESLQVPDLNGNVLDCSSSDKTLPDEKNQEKAEKKRVVNKVEDPGGSLVLNFAQGIPLPSKEMLVATFSRFGLLKESEIKVADDNSSVEIVYERSSEARFAFRSLEKKSNDVFGESLVGFKLNCVPVVPPAGHSRTKEKRNKPKGVKTPHVPMNACQNKNIPLPDMTFIRQNVEKMKLTLEKAGNSLSPEIRAKLEDEIKVFLEKIASVGGSSSS
ncbi:hypothetical protein ACP275_09G022900 [Erythranthe tilingii]